MISYPPAQAPIPTSYLFIDGNALRITIEKISNRLFDGVSVPVDWRKLRGTNRKAFYYDAIPVQLQHETEDDYSARVSPKRTELLKIERESGYHVRSGDAVHRKRRGNEQKMVDVQLAVDALLMGSRGLFERITIITGDLDFKPLITALVDMGIDVNLRYPAGEASDYLLAAADQAGAIDIDYAKNWIESDFFKSNPLPEALFNFQNSIHHNGDVIVNWNDLRYGQCKVLDLGDKLMVVSEKEPHNPNTHRLELTSNRKIQLRNYASDVFGLEIPQW